MKGGSNPNLNNSVEIKALAWAAGVQPRTIKQFGQRECAKGKRCLKGNGYITLDACERYMNPRGIPRTSVKPWGACTTKALQSTLNASKNKIYRLIHKKTLKAHYYRGAYLIDPEDAKWLELKLKDHRPLVGWDLVAGVRAATGRTQQALDAWIKRHKIPIRFYLHPHMSKLVRYMPTHDAKAYQALASKTNKYTPKTHLNPSLLEPLINPTPHLGATQPSQIDIACPVVHPEPCHQQQEPLILKEEPHAEQNPCPHHGDNSPRSLPHLRRLRPERSTPDSHHTGGQPRGPTHLGAS